MCIRDRSYREEVQCSRFCPGCTAIIKEIIIKYCTWQNTPKLWRIWWCIKRYTENAVFGYVLLLCGKMCIRDSYTAARRKRSDDAYSPGGKAGKRPDRAVTVYTKKIKEIYPDSPVVIAGCLLYTSLPCYH